MGASWESFVIENILSVANPIEPPSFYRTAAGSEIDLLLRHGQQLWAIEIKRSLSPTIGRGFHQAIEDVSPDRAAIVYAGRDGFPLSKDVEAIGLEAFLQQLAETV